MRPTKPTIELPGVVASIRWRSKDQDQPCVIAYLESGDSIVGAAADGELVPGCPYRFYGYWDEHARFGKQFRFQQFLKLEPHERQGIIAYLTRNCPHVGPAIAQRLWDHFQGDAVRTLRLNPALAGMMCGLTESRAKEAAAALDALKATEDTKIDLTNLFTGRGFPGALVDACIAKWGILAPAHIRRDPFSLLVNEMPGCGFARCDRLYLDLGLDPGRLKRQVICLWHKVLEDSEKLGHTWIALRAVEVMLEQTISSTKVKAGSALKLAIRARWLAKHVDSEKRVWVAAWENAANEAELAQRVRGLVKGLVAA